VRRRARIAASWCYLEDVTGIAQLSSPSARVLDPRRFLAANRCAPTPAADRRSASPAPVLAPLLLSVSTKVVAAT